ncbi:hypothetical protein BFJ66_g11235 [Fusarium oxysporum f. sp. cepae]|uniref:Apple domain-containing protein n=1 Tax=Fusarium oxysporum f. sp. cepae TaxID=396571 RepID=A0A3L6NSF3_FUSOX|nr:hypothetical protein BFJ65_g4262 [Fusarium oxysporum f. sp. cepae]RKK40515.1 hypothetical protein BFJ67_g10981 [Fusarium oxysporum f. sp. cepae]RKK41006.1 hypothetical protein BFJ66_g11235 [Fusarium oxysporum f. sp. cepae]
MKATLLSALLIASASADAGTCTKDACLKAVGLSNCRARRWPPAHESDCSSFLRYTSIPSATTVTATGEQSTVTLKDTETLGPQTDEATATHATTSITSDLVTVFVAITPTKTVTVTITPDPYLETDVNAKTVVQTDVNTITETTYFGLLSKRAIAARSTKNILRPTDIPSYAASCTDAEQYSSACACMGVQETTIEGTGSIITETVELHPETVVDVRTETRPAVTITTTLPAKTRTVTVTLPGRQITETTTADATTVSTSFTADQDTSVITQHATEVDQTTSVTTKTRSVGPICTTYTPSQTSCNCKFEVLCDQAVTVSLSNFERHIDFNTFVGSFEEFMQRCDNNPSCQFGDFASLPQGGLCSSYSGNPGDSGTSSRSGSKYFEKDGNVDCSSCSQ